MKLKNIEAGQRGVYVGGDEKPVLLMLESGETSDEVTLSEGQTEAAKRTEWFEFSGRSAPKNDDK